MWICTRHKDRNSTSLEQFREEIKTKFKLEFGFVVSCPIVSPSRLEVIYSAKEESKSKQSSPKVKKKSKGFKLCTPKITKPQLEKALDDALNNRAVNTSNEDIQTTASNVDLQSAATCNHKKLNSLSTDQALNKMKRKLSDEGVNDKLNPIAKGRAQFMIGNS